MNRQSKWLLFVALALIGATGLLLSRVGSLQRLGKPGVVVQSVPIPGTDATATGTNAFFWAGTNSVFLPIKILNYDSKVVPVSRVVYDWLPRDTTYGQRRYLAPDGFFVDATVVLMGSDRTSIHQPQYCLTGAGWRIDQEETATVRISRPQAYDLEVMKLTTTAQLPTEKGGRQMFRGIFVYWFVADGQLTARHGQRMWWMARDLITKGLLQRWAYVSCFAVCPPGQEDATFERVKDFIRASVPEFQLATGAPVTELTQNQAP